MRSALALCTAAAAFPASSPYAGDLLAQLERLRSLFKARLAPPPPRFEASRKLTGCAARRPRALSWAWCSATSLAEAARLAPLRPQASQATPPRLRRAPPPRHATGPSNLWLTLLLLTLTGACLAPVRAQECAAPGGAYLSGRLHGGLGNQLFIQARVHSLALATQRQAVIYPPAAPSGMHTRAGAYLGTLFAGYRQEVDAPPDYRFEEAPLDALRYVSKQPLLPPQSRHAHLVGYFQHQAYIHPTFAATLRLPQVPARPHTAFVHVRRGDYVEHPLHDVGLAASGYYATAMDYMRLRLRDPRMRFLVFSDDVPWCRTSGLFSDPDVEFYEHQAIGGDHGEDNDEDLLALANMAACLLGGVGANSSFSWWAAYLNGNVNKLVLLPDKWTMNPAMEMQMWPSGSFLVSLDGRAFVRPWRQRQLHVVLSAAHTPAATMHLAHVRRAWAELAGAGVTVALVGSGPSSEVSSDDPDVLHLPSVPGAYDGDAARWACVLAAGLTTAREGALVLVSDEPHVMPLSESALERLFSEEEAAEGATRDGATSDDAAPPMVLSARSDGASGLLLYAAASGPAWRAVTGVSDWAGHASALRTHAPGGALALLPWLAARCAAAGVQLRVPSQPLHRLVLRGGAASLRQADLLRLREGAFTDAQLSIETADAPLLDALLFAARTAGPLPLLSAWPGPAHHPPPASPLFDLVLYINLQAREDKRAQLEAQLALVGWPALRLNATWHSRGEVGCALSHAAALRAFLAHPDVPRHVLILEDDFQFVRDPRDDVARFMHAFPPTAWDVLMLSSNTFLEVPHPSERFLSRVLNAQTTSGYAVTRAFAPKLLTLFQDSSAALLADQQGVEGLEIDQLWKALQQPSEWFSLQPRAGRQRPGRSDITGLYVDQGV